MATIATLAINLIGNVSGLKRALGDARQSITATSESLKSVGTKMTAAVSLPILGVAGAALKGAAEMEQLEVAFTTMLRSADAAKSLMADLTAFSAETPFELPEVVNAGKMLLAYGVEANNVKNTLRQLGDIAAGVGAPIGDIAYLFGTARVQGRLFAMDINQFTNRGIPIISALAKTMGVAEGSIKKLVEEGKVGFPELQAALDYLTESGGQFEGLMAAQSQTLAGLFSTLKDNVGITLSTIGRSIVEAFDLRSKLGSALDVLGQVKDFIVNLAQTNPQLLKTAVIITAVAAAIGPLIVGLGFVVGAVGNLVPVIGALMGPMGLLALAVVGLGIAWYTNFGGIRDITLAVWSSVQPILIEWTTWLQVNLPIALATVQAWATTAWTTVSGAVTQAWATVGPTLTQLWTWLQVNIPIALATVQAWATTAWTTVSGAVTQAWATIGPTLTQLWTWLQVNIPIALATVQQWFATAWAEAPSALTAAWATMSGTLTQMWTWLQINIPIALATVQVWATTAWTTVSGAVTQAWATIQPILEQIRNGFAAVASLLAPSLARLRLSFSSMFTAFGEMGPLFAELQESVSNVVTALTPHVRAFGLTIGVALGIVAVFAINTLSAVFEALPGVVEVVVSQVTAILNMIATTVQSVTQIVTGLLTGDFASAWEGVKTLIGGLNTYVQTTLVNLGATVLLAFTLVRSVLVSTFTDLATTLGLDGLVTIISNIDTAIGNVITNIGNFPATIATKAPEWIDSLIAWVWPDFIETPEWVTSLIDWVWPDFIETPEWVTSLMAWAWPAFIAKPEWLTGLFAWDWPTFPSAPAWVTSLFNWNWPAFPSAPSWLNNLNLFGGGGNNAGTNALGTQYWRGGATWVGDGGKPELVMLPRGSQVIPERFAGAGAGGPAVVIERMEVRSEADIYRVAYQVDDIRRRRRR